MRLLHILIAFYCIIEPLCTVGDAEFSGVLPGHGARHMRFVA